MEAKRHVRDRPPPGSDRNRGSGGRVHNFENKFELSIATCILAKQHMVAELADPTLADGITGSQRRTLSKGDKSSWPWDCGITPCARNRRTDGPGKHPRELVHVRADHRPILYGSARPLRLGQESLVP